MLHRCIFININIKERIVLLFANYLFCLIIPRYLDSPKYWGMQTLYNVCHQHTANLLQYTKFKGAAW